MTIEWLSTVQQIVDVSSQQYLGGGRLAQWIRYLLLDPAARAQTITSEFFSKTTFFVLPLKPPVHCLVWMDSAKLNSWLNSSSTSQWLASAEKSRIYFFWKHLFF